MTAGTSIIIPQKADEFILASASLRRLELLAQIGQVPSAIVPADIDENPFGREIPKQHAERLAREKAAKVAASDDVSVNQAGKLILAADTVVACGKRILPKAEDERQARRCLAMLSGRRHRVITGISLVLPCGKQLTKSVSTVVAFKVLSQQDTERYIASGEWHGKAGGYAIQGLGATFIRFISGSYSNVVGLPLFEVGGWLEAHLQRSADT